MTRRTSAVLAIVVLLLTVGCSTTESSPTGTSAASAPATSIPSALKWRDCPQRKHTCADLSVPIDRRNPSAGAVTLTLIRAAAARQPAEGTLVVNPGGPGADAAPIIDAIPSPISDSFDVIGYTPRGVNPAVDCAGGWRHADPLPDTDLERQSLDTVAANVSIACQNGFGALAPHITVDDLADDLETLRVALGSAPLNYLGFSYGSAIGVRYLERYGDHVRAMVLDGVTDPSADLFTALHQQAEAFTAVTDRLLRDCGGCDFNALHDTLSTTPLGRLGPGELVWATFAAGYSTNAAAKYRAAFHDAQRGDPTGMLSLSDQYTRSGSYAAYTATLCDSLPHPADLRSWHDAAAQQPGPLGPAFIYELLPCATWPSTAAPPTAIARASNGTLPVMLIGNTGDFATPLANAERLHQQLAGSYLLTVTMTGHTAIPANACAAVAAAAYLKHLTAPPVTC